MLMPAECPSLGRGALRSVEERRAALEPSSQKPEGRRMACEHSALDSGWGPRVLAAHRTVWFIECLHCLEVLL